MSRKKILWLTSWYPNRTDPFDGDFIQRQAVAAAIHHDIHVLFVTGAGKGEPLTAVTHPVPGLTEQICYFPEPKGAFAKPLRQLRWMQTMRKALKNFLEKERPSLVHVHVPWKAGLAALWLKRKYGLPYLITEHWGIYDEEFGDTLLVRSRPARIGLGAIYREAAGVVAVSQYLGSGIQKQFGVPFQVIPNVVDTGLFYRGGQKLPVFTFLHVSNMAPVKRVEGILEAFRLLMRKNLPKDAQLVLIGNRDEAFRDAEREPELAGRVFFKGELPYEDVAHWMRIAHCFVLFSDAETFSCVTAEALCAGLPVIATHTAALPELVRPGMGTLVAPGDLEALASAMEEAVRKGGDPSFEPQPNGARDLYSYVQVGAQLAELYTATEADGEEKGLKKGKRSPK